ncbi:hypothetical protein ACFSHT_13605 [Paraburkholderia silviterrae]|uniref:SbsA Ig-like domain-containing protein n=1 Tax=Paraburkholderia silviterrae TaxID=2528715 RepID=A0A4V2ZXT6_9BURK|nr:hypothetical protein [Paraburkholderia silviterrae]TDG16736.1 hypothetical protein EYW47_39920 [Paraburkholderia silviterrae]
MTTHSRLSGSHAGASRKEIEWGIQVTLQPTLRVDYDRGEHGTACVDVHNLDPDFAVLLDEHRKSDCLLQSVLRVNVIDPDLRRCDDLPNVPGGYQILADGLRFSPCFPFESGVRYRASFDPRPLSRAGYQDVLTLEFSLANPAAVEPASVIGVFPSADVLPENLLRFYICFSRSMQRGRAEEQIRLLGPDGRPTPDVLYRPPLELWDRSMRCLTVLLDPGRLKRWVGPNRELGPPLKAGQRYVLAIGSEMVDACGRMLRNSFYKPFSVEAAVREPIAVAHWKILAPVAKSRQPLVILFSTPLDWALLSHAIAVAPEGGSALAGRISIDRGERRWSFAPVSPWAAGRYSICVASYLEDVCGNRVLAAFDRPLRPGTDLTVETADCLITFRVSGPLDPAAFARPLAPPGTSSIRRLSVNLIEDGARA